MRNLSLFLVYGVILVSCNLTIESTNINNTLIANTSSPKIKKCKITQNLNNPNINVAVTTNYITKTATPDFSTFFPIINYSSTEKNIRYADYSVFNSSGAIVDCGNTGSAGQFNLLLESNTEYNLIVYSHSIDSDVANVAVINSPDKNLPYSISKSFNTGNTSSVHLVSILSATSNSNLNTHASGAFNILDQVIESNLFLKTNTKSCESCTSSFSNTPFLEIYWKPGLNPNNYLNNSSPVSFFFNFVKNNTPYYRIFILGGMNGMNDANLDTDEFDDSIIIHEYAHFLISVFSKDGSPGGSHSGSESIDPRLAWSEGFADFFQAAVLNKGYYLDVVGNNESLLIPLENQSHDSQNSLPNRDTPRIVGEGNYREFGIARFFWDVIDSEENYDSQSDDDNYIGTAADFKWIWDVITSSAFTNNAFPTIGLFNEVQNFQLASNPIPWGSLRDLHLQHNPAHLFFRSLYALKLSHNCQPTSELLKFNETQQPNISNYMVQHKRVLEYHHTTEEPLFLGLKGRSDIKFYIQNLNTSMTNNRSTNLFQRNYIHRSAADENCLSQGYNQCLNVNLKQGHYLIETVLQSEISETANFQFFANNQELCGEHSLTENLLMSAFLSPRELASYPSEKWASYTARKSAFPNSQESISYNSKKSISHKLTAPFDLNIVALKNKEKDHTYQLKATFSNKNLNLQNLDLQWRHSDNIKIIDGTLQKNFSAVAPEEKITLQVLITTTAPLDTAKIYLLTKANYGNRSFPKALAFTLKQLIDKSTQQKKMFFQKSTKPKILQNSNVIIHH